MASRKLEDMDELVLKQFLDFIHEAKKENIDLLVYCTHRANSEQDELYTHGRTAGGHIVTNAKGGQSPHNCARGGKPKSLAMDVVPLVNGKPQWSAHGNMISTWAKVGEIAKHHGLEWGGNFKGSLIDYPHVQFKNWRKHNETYNLKKT